MGPEGFVGGPGPIGPKGEAGHVGRRGPSGLKGDKVRFTLEYKVDNVYITPVVLKVHCYIVQYVLFIYLTGPNGCSWVQW